jgi:L-ascorbate metabolism protein UlaG (beta-lactamase superfamily)
MKRFLKILKRTFLVLMSIILVLAIATYFYMRKPVFGQSPEGDRLTRIEKSPHYKDGHFHNLVEKPIIADGYSIMGELYKTVFAKKPRVKPEGDIPAQKTDLKTLSLDSNVVVWFGHSSVFIQADKKTFLIDPIFSGNASPIPGSLKAFKGSNNYKAVDMPEIDYLIISHDHYDHLDHETVLALKNKVKFIICGLGVGAHFEKWGYPPAKIIERDWNEKVDLDFGITIFTNPTHHDSGRGFSGAKTLWMSYLIQTPSFKIFYSGDGGYDKHFAEIGKKFGSIDLAILENGQYDKAWHSVHLLPNETLKAAQDLKAKRILPVHNSKFVLAKHTWDDPMIQLTELNKRYHFNLATPMIGETVNLNNKNQVFTQWWKNVK